MAKYYLQYISYDERYFFLLAASRNPQNMVHLLDWSSISFYKWPAHLPQIQRPSENFLYNSISFSPAPTRFVAASSAIFLYEYWASIINTRLQEWTKLFCLIIWQRGHIGLRRMSLVTKIHNTLSHLIFDSVFSG